MGTMVWSITGRLPVGGFASHLLHQVDVPRDSLGFGIEGTHLVQDIGELDGGDAAAAQAEMLDHFTGGDKGIEGTCVLEFLVPCLVNGGIYGFLTPMAAARMEDRPVSFKFHAQAFLWHPVDYKLSWTFTLISLSPIKG